MDIISAWNSLSPFKSLLKADNNGVLVEGYPIEEGPFWAKNTR
jgi:hypothetical protein